MRKAWAPGRLFLEVGDRQSGGAGALCRTGLCKVGLRKAYYDGKDAQDALKAALPLPTGQTISPKLGAAIAHGDECVTRIEKLCVDKGLRMTEQRRVIARVLSDAGDHPDAEELYRRAAAIDPHISIATVYRTVKLFEDAGILERHDFRDGRARYEEVPESHHDHLIDVQTGSVIEFRNEEIEKLQRRVAEELGFELVDHRLELYGVPKGKKPKALMPTMPRAPFVLTVFLVVTFMLIPLQWLLLKLNLPAPPHLSPSLSSLCRAAVRHPHPRDRQAA